MTGTAALPPLSAGPTRLTGAWSLSHLEAPVHPDGPLNPLAQAAQDLDVPTPVRWTLLDVTEDETGAPALAWRSSHAHLEWAVQAMEYAASRTSAAGLGGALTMRRADVPSLVPLGAQSVATLSEAYVLSYNYGEGPAAGRPACAALVLATLHAPPLELLARLPDTPPSPLDPGPPFDLAALAAELGAAAALQWALEGAL